MTPGRSEQTAGESGHVAEARWRAVIDAAVDGIVVIDSRGLIEAFNPAAQRMFGYGEAEVVGKNVKVLMPEPDRSSHDAHITHHRRPAVIAGIGIQVAAASWPFTSDLLGHAAIPVELWGAVLGGALLAWGLAETTAQFVGRQGESAPQARA